MRRNFDARDEVARLDDLAVEDGEDLERIDPIQPLQLGDADVGDPRGFGDQVDPALCGPANDQTRTGDRCGKAMRGFVLVEIVGIEEQDRHGDRQTV